MTTTYAAWDPSTEEYLRTPGEYGDSTFRNWMFEVIDDAGADVVDGLDYWEQSGKSCARWNPAKGWHRPTVGNDRPVKGWDYEERKDQ